MIRILAFFITVALSSPSHACDREYIGQKEAFEQADVVFMGTPIEKGKRFADPTPSKDLKEINEAYFNSYYEVVFEVDRIWKGTKGENIYILDSDDECGHHTGSRIGENMLVYAKFDDDGLKIMNVKGDDIKKLGKAIWPLEKEKSK